MMQQYENPKKSDLAHANEEYDEKPVDLTFKFPKEKDTIISKIIISLDDKTIQADVTLK